MSEFSKFDTQIHCEEVFSFQPTQADLKELDEWIEEVEGESGWEELESDDGHRELYEEDYEPEDDYYGYADLMENYYE